MKALVDTGACDCFMSRAARKELPPEQVVDSWQVDKGQIQLADNSNLTIPEQVRVKFRPNCLDQTVKYLEEIL